MRQDPLFADRLVGSAIGSFLMLVSLFCYFFIRPWLGFACWLTAIAVLWLAMRLEVWQEVYFTLVKAENEFDACSTFIAVITLFAMFWLFS